MNQLTVKTSEPPRRNFETDVPRADLTSGRQPVSGKLWAAMAGAAVVAAVSVASLAAPVQPPAGDSTTAAAPVVRAAPLPLDPFADPDGGSGTSGTLQQQGSAPAAVDVPAVAAAAPAEAPAAPAPAPPAPEPAPAPAGDSNSYTVVPGDTVGGIAARFGVDLNAMLAANGLAAYSIIYPGQTLKLAGPAVAAPVAAPANAPAPAPAPAPAYVQAAPAVRTIYVAGSGGQALLDTCIGPIHYTPNDGYSLFIVEHDFCGGWARFSGIAVGETISIPGYGTYTATARGQVPNPGSTNDVVAQFGGFPRAILQTCIPGTSQMLLIALN
jgi:LysM repeat protein